MPENLSKLTFKPGINRDQTNYASEGGWYECQLVRFRSGFPEKIGGWIEINQTKYNGVCRSLFPYSASDGANLIGIGTNNQIYVQYGTQLANITPVRSIFAPTATNNCIETTSGSNTVTVTLSSHGAKAGNFVTISGVVGNTFTGCAYSISDKTATITQAAHGLQIGDVVNITFSTNPPPNANYSVISVTTNTFSVIVPDGSGTGTATVISPRLNGVNVNNTFKIESVPTANTFTITASNSASSTGSGGGSNIFVSFKIFSGPASVTTGYGWGVGAWSTGKWGRGGTVPLNIQGRLVFQDKFNDGITFNDALFFNVRNATGGDLYGLTGTNIFYFNYNSNWNTNAIRLGATYSIPANSTTCTITVPHDFYPLSTPAPYVNLSFLAAVGGAPASTPTVYQIATATSATSFTVTVASSTTYDRSGSVEIAGLTSVPRQVGQILFAPSGHLLALGCTTYEVPNSSGTIISNATYDPLLIRWSNVDPVNGPQPQIWYPTALNTAGDLRVKSGSSIYCGYRTRQEIVIFTDSSINSLQFLGSADVFGLTEIDANISIMGPNVVSSANNIVYWMGVDKFYQYGGRVDTLPCTLRQYIFQSPGFNKNLTSLFFSGTNSQFNEIIWFYADANSNYINRYVIYNYLENIWYYGMLARTAWSDLGWPVNPISANGNYYVETDPAAIVDPTIIGQDTGNTLGNTFNQEVGTDSVTYSGVATPITSYIKSADMDIGDGYQFMLTRKIIPDVNFTNSNTSLNANPSVYMTVNVRNFPGATQVTTNEENQSLQRTVTTTANINQYTNQIFLRARGRQISFDIGSTDLGVQWQMGAVRLEAREDGRRGGENP